MAPWGSVTEAAKSSQCLGSEAPKPHFVHILLAKQSQDSLRFKGGEAFSLLMAGNKSTCRD